MLTMDNKKVLIYAGPDFEDQELTYPLHRFKEAGATVKVAGLGQQEYTGKKGVSVTVDDRYEQFVDEDWDVVIVPGGWAPDKIRMNPSALKIVQNTLKNDGVVGAICHAGWVLASAGVLKDRTATSYIAIKDDMVNAGANWVDEEAVVDTSGPGTIVTSRTPADLPAFCRSIIEAAMKPVSA